jgi:hypothetical protein
MNAEIVIELMPNGEIHSISNPFDFGSLDTSTLSQKRHVSRPHRPNTLQSPLEYRVFLIQKSGFVQKALLF